MKWWGKILGGALGYALTGSITGVIIGVFLGHLFDRNSRSRGGAGRFEGFGRANQEQTQAAFFTATFSVMGHISKADGRVSPEEIKLAEQVMQQMRLSKEQRIAAIEHFNYGKHEDFNFDEVLQVFRQACHRKTSLMQMFIEIQLQAAYADGIKSSAEEQILQHICKVLGYPAMLLAQMEAMFFASKRSHKSYGSNGTNSLSALKDAYEIIGVNSSATDSEVKKAYRRLMSKNHPDKLISKGLPEEMIEIATNKTQEIQKAYDLISNSRG
jgi:DnaJ like chaperone protein